MSTQSHRPDLPIGRLTFAGCLVVALLGVGTITWGMATKITGAIIASGFVEYDQHRQTIQHPDGGIVSRILVRNGDLVPAGKTLIELDRSALLSEQAIIENQRYELMARRGRLMAESTGTTTIEFPQPLIDAATSDDISALMQGQIQLFDIRVSSHQSKITQLNAQNIAVSEQIEGLAAQRNALIRQLDLTGQELQHRQALSKRGLARSSELLTLRLELSKLQATVAELAVKRSVLSERRSSVILGTDQLNALRREKAITRLRDLRHQEREINETYLRLKTRLDQMDIRAPTAGIVHRLQVFGEKSIIRPAESILQLIAYDQMPVISADISPLDVDQVYVGQLVEVRFIASDGANPPALFGHVTTISAAAIVDPERGRAYYRAEIGFEHAELTEFVETHRLLAGMPVEVYLRTQEQTPVSFLIGPIKDIMHRSFREG